jgi:hypothetical protein
VKYQFPEFQDNDILQTFIHETGDVGFINFANEIGLLKGTEVSRFVRGYDESQLIKLFSHQEKTSSIKFLISKIRYVQFLDY